MYKILIADDEKKIRETLSDYLVSKDFEVILAKDGEEAVDFALYENVFDLIILDAMMPKINGIEACRQIRKSQNVPILFLSALGEEKNLLAGYSVGADDYIVKPFPLSVLTEKRMAMIRRSKGTNQKNQLQISGIVLDYKTKRITAEGKEIVLPAKDFAILAYLMENKNIVLEREIILTRVWGYDFEGDTRVVDTHIKRIRKALGKKAGCIVTVVGTGYVFKEESI